MAERMPISTAEVHDTSPEELQAQFDLPSATSPSSVQEIYNAEPLGPEDAPELEPASGPEAEQVRFQNRELLTGSKRVKAEIHHVGNRTFEGLQLGVAKTANFLTSPKKAWREFIRKRSELSLSRKTNRLEQIEAQLEKNETLADSTPGRNLLKGMRQRKLESARDRQQAKVDVAEQRFDYRQQRHDDYVEVRQQRETSVKDSAAEKREAFTSELVSKKQEALARKEIRRNLKAEGAKRSERNEVLAILSNEQLYEVGRAMIQFKTAERIDKKMNKLEVNIEKQQQAVGAKLKEFSHRANHYRELARANQQALEEFNSDPGNIAIIEAARQRIQELTGSAEALGEGDDAKRAREQAIAEQNSIINSLNEQAEAIKRQILGAQEMTREMDQGVAKAEVELEQLTLEQQKMASAATATSAVRSRLRGVVDETLIKTYDELSQPAFEADTAEAADQGDKGQEESAGPESDSQTPEPVASSQPVKQRFGGGESLAAGVEKVVHEFFGGDQALVLNFLKEGYRFEDWKAATPPGVLDSIGAKRVRILERNWPIYQQDVKR